LVIAVQHEIQSRHSMNWYRDSEDEDGTRHYTVGGMLIGRPPQKVSLTREQRRRANRAAAVVVAALVLGPAIGAWVGHSVGHNADGTFIGACVGSALPLMVGLGVVFPVVSLVMGIRGARQVARDHHSGGGDQPGT
jgi:hypothetical protein